MKSIKLFTYLIITVLTISCNSDNVENGNDLTNAVSKLGCSNVSGPTAVYWDYAHGIPAPLSRIPMIQNPAGRFNHQAVFTNINFSIPQGYTPTQILVQNSTYGVDLRRSNNDVQNKVFWRYYPIASFSGNLTVDQIRAIVINDLMINEYGFNGSPNVDCAPINQTVDFGGGFTRTFSSRAITFQNIKAIIWIALTQTGFSNSATISVSAGPINEFDNLVMDVFLPISFELLINDRDTLSDRDEDGTPDIYDPDPDDPNIR